MFGNNKYVTEDLHPINKCMKHNCCWHKTGIISGWNWQKLKQMTMIQSGLQPITV